MTVQGATVGDIQQAAALMIGGEPADWGFSDFNATGVWGYPKTIGAGWSVNDLVADTSVSSTCEEIVGGLAPGRYYEIHVVAGGKNTTTDNWAIQAGFSPKAWSLSTADIALDGNIPKAELFIKDSTTSMYAIKLGAVPADSNGTCRVYLDTGVGVADALATGDRCIYDGLLYREVPPPSHPADLQSDSWVAVDALGRPLPGYGEVGALESHRMVGIFYFLWLSQHSQTGPWDNTQLLAANPTNPAWGPEHHFHHWGESETGYYRSDDPYVIRRHASMLVDAGVDVVIFDVTNAFIYEDNYKKVCAVYMQIRAEGGRTPQIAFLAHSSPVTTVNKLYDRFYSLGLYQDLWFYWKGKPLLLTDTTVTYSAEVAGFFSMRHSWAWGSTALDTWNWLDHYPQHYGWHESSSRPEQISVSVAQHATTSIGRSYFGGSEPPVDQYHLTGMEEYGYCFDEQWSRAHAVDPEFIFVTGWNEWVAQRFITDTARPFAGGTIPAGGTYFVDAFNMEFNRDIEPMKGGTTDSYYYQLVSNIRKYKGVRPPSVAGASHAIAIDGSFDDWLPVESVYYDTYGDPVSRDWRGWGDSGVTYTNHTGRNDILQSRATFDAADLFFHVETAADLTPCTDPHWMELFIDTDQNHSTGWEGYDFRVVGHASNGTAVVEQFSGATWASVGSAAFHASGNRMELALPRALVGETTLPLEFDFHWADNVQAENDIAEFSISGDSAPNRRFNYRYSTVPAEDPPTLEFHFETDGDFEGWDDIPLNVSGLVVSNGALSGVATTLDPYFHNFSVDFDGSDVAKIAVRMRATAAGPVQLYWVPDGGSWNYLQTDYTEVDEWQVVEFECSKSGAWAGQRIGVLRLDPIGVAGAGFDIDWIRSAKGDADADGICDNTERLIDSDNDGIRDYLDEDSDNDGFSDLHENAMGTDPLNPGDNDVFVSSPDIPVQVDGKAGRLYSLQWTGSLVSVDWGTVETAGPLPVDLPVQFTNGMPSTNGFYRVQVEHP